MMQYHHPQLASEEKMKETSLNKYYVKLLQRLVQLIVVAKQRPSITELMKPQQFR